MNELNATAHRILDAAEYYTQTRGFNAFSYKDIQNEVGIKTASIHYYFPSKQDLALAMADRYIQHFASALADIRQQEQDGLKQLFMLGGIFSQVLKAKKFCMCGMLASDLLALSDEVTDKLQEFFQLNENWIMESINHAKAEGKIPDNVDSAMAAAHFLATLEGGMLIARAKADKRDEYMETVVKQALEQLTR